MVLFYIFATVMLLSALVVVLFNNVLYNLIGLILTFVSATCLMVLMGSEFSAFAFLALQGGAIIILLTVGLITLNLKSETKKINKTVLFTIAIILAEFVTLFIYKGEIGVSIAYQQQNLEKLAQVIFYDYGMVLILISVILLATMIGVITIVLVGNKSIKKQNIQINRKKQDSVELRKIKPGSPASY